MSNEHLVRLCICWLALQPQAKISPLFALDTSSQTTVVNFAMTAFAQTERIQAWGTDVPAVPIEPLLCHC